MRVAGRCQAIVGGTCAGLSRMGVCQVMWWHRQSVRAVVCSVGIHTGQTQTLQISRLR